MTRKIANFGLPTALDQLRGTVYICHPPERRIAGVTSEKAKNIVELRQLLAEKFPGVRMAAGRPESLVKRWPTGVSAVDFHLDGGLAKSALTEIISSGARCGTALLLGAIIQQAQENGEWVALIDGSDSFDPGALRNEELSRLLWVRCSNSREAMKATDLLLHDGTIPIVVIDLIGCPLKQLRRIPSSTWHRLSRTVETTATVCPVFTPEVMISTAETRIELQPRFTLEALDAERETLLSQIVARVVTSELGAVDGTKRFGVAG